MKNLNIIIVWYNEEKNLQKCFKSINNFENKLNINVIYCDQSSTDNSVNIAKNFWISIRNHPKYGMAEFSRMKIVEKEIKIWEWLLFLDADEEITKSLANEITAIVDKNKFDIWILPIDLYFMKIKANTAMQPRLFKKWAMKLQWIPHNALIPLSDNKKILTNKLINLDLKNNGCEIQNQLEKLNRYTSIDVNKIENTSNIKLFYWLFIKPLIRFFGFWLYWWYFFKWTPGRILAFHNASYEFFKYAKLYEKFKLKDFKTHKK